MLMTHALEDFSAEETAQQGAEMVEQMAAETNEINLNQKVPHMEGVGSATQQSKHQLLHGSVSSVFGFLFERHPHSEPLQRGC